MKINNDGVLCDEEDVPVGILVYVEFRSRDGFGGPIRKLIQANELEVVRPFIRQCYMIDDGKIQLLEEHPWEDLSALVEQTKTRVQLLGFEAPSTKSAP